MSSFDYELKDHLRRAGAPVIDYAEPTPSEALSRVKEAHEAQMAAQKRLTTAWINFALWLGFVFGISCSALVARIAGVL